MLRADRFADDELPLFGEDGSDAEAPQPHRGSSSQRRIMVGGGGLVLLLGAVALTMTIPHGRQAGAKPSGVSELFSHMGGFHGGAQPHIAGGIAGSAPIAAAAAVAAAGASNVTAPVVAAARPVAAAAGAAVAAAGAQPTEVPRNLQGGASDPFDIRFHVGGLAGSEGTGSFVVRVHPSWAPHGAARIREIVSGQVWDGARFFRVVPGFVAQWGIPAEASDAAHWQEDTIEDDPRREDVHNLEGYVTFATAGPGSRTTQVFIDLADNSNLDSMGFPPFGRVTEGMDVVRQIYADYGEDPDQGQIQADGNEYLQREFPNLSFISRLTMES